jgi:predicted transcriptional regulator
MRREKREETVTIRMPPLLKKAIKEIARSDDRTVSSFIIRALESRSDVRIAFQQIDGSGERL